MKAKSLRAIAAATSGTDLGQRWDHAGCPSNRLRTSSCESKRLRRSGGMCSFMTRVGIGSQKISTVLRKSRLMFRSRARTLKKIFISGVSFAGLAALLWCGADDMTNPTQRARRKNEAEMSDSGTTAKKRPSVFAFTEHYTCMIGQRPGKNEYEPL